MIDLQLTIIDYIFADEGEQDDEDEGDYEVIENGRNNGHIYFNENYEGAMEDGMLQFIYFSNC